MTFPSWQFGVVAAIVFAAYYLPALRAFQVQLLVFASLLFYGYGQSELLPLTFASMSARIDRITVVESSEFSRYPSPDVILGMMELGAHPDRRVPAEVPLPVAPG